MKIRTGYVIAGSMARAVKEMNAARLVAHGCRKALLLYNKNPDVEEIVQFLSFVDGERPHVVEGTDEVQLKDLLERGVENVLVTNGDALPMHFQLEVGDPSYKWPARWTILARDEMGMMSVPRGPWATCFVYNAFLRSVPWKNVGERPKRDFLEMLAAFIRAAGVTCEARVLSEGFENFSKKNIRGIADVRAMAETMVQSARQDVRTQITRADVLVGIALKPNRGGPSADHTLQVAHMRVAGDDVPAVALQ